MKFSAEIPERPEVGISPFRSQVRKETTPSFQDTSRPHSSSFLSTPPMWTFLCACTSADSAPRLNTPSNKTCALWRHRAKRRTQNASTKQNLLAGENPVASTTFQSLFMHSLLWNTRHDRLWIKLNWAVVWMIAVGSEVTVCWEDSVCFMRNVLGASLFTQASLHIFEKDKSGVGKLERKRGAGWGIKIFGLKGSTTWLRWHLMQHVWMYMCCLWVRGWCEGHVSTAGAWICCVLSISSSPDWGVCACAVLLLGDNCNPVPIPSPLCRCELVWAYLSVWWVHYG